MESGSGLSPARTLRPHVVLLDPLIEELCAENSFTYLDVIAAHRHHSDDVSIPKKHRVLRAPLARNSEGLLADRNGVSVLIGALRDQVLVGCEDRFSRFRARELDDDEDQDRIKRRLWENRTLKKKSSKRLQEKL